jgi:hypothetical protein
MPHKITCSRMKTKSVAEGETRQADPIHHNVTRSMLRRITNAAERGVGFESWTSETLTQHDPRSTWQRPQGKRNLHLIVQIPTKRPPLRPHSGLSRKNERRHPTLTSEGRPRNLLTRSMSSRSPHQVQVAFEAIIIRDVKA